MHTVLAQNPDLLFTAYPDSVLLGRFRVDITAAGTYKVTSLLETSFTQEFGAGERSELIHFLLDRMTGEDAN